MDTPTFSLFFALLAVAGLAVLAVAAVAGAVRLATGGRVAPLAAVTAAVAGAAVPLAFVVSTVATAGSLYYSEVAGFEPCRLCWYQRIAMYPLVVLTAVAWATGDRAVRRYALPLAGLGLAVSVLHRLEEQFPQRLGGVCTVGVPCSTRYVDQWGWVTIPTMAGVAFGLVIVVLSLSSREAAP